MSTYSDFVSTERCVELTGLSKYEVAVLVAKRARELASSAAPLVSRNNKKNINLALVELDSGSLNIGELSDRLVYSLRTAAKSAKDGGRPTKQPAPFEPDDLLRELKRDMLNESSGDIVISEGTLSNEDKNLMSYAEEEISDPDQDPGHSA